jgi:thioredoxin reductase (NADPH)
MATGARWRELHADGMDRFRGAGVYHAAMPTDAERARDKDVIVIGGGNSAGQAAAGLAKKARSVTVIVRGKALKSTMSRYLVDRVERSPRIEVLTETEVVALHGTAVVESATLQSSDGSRREIETSAVFVMIGADPCTGWLDGTMGLDDRGFVLTGEACGAAAPQPFNIFQTTAPGVFAVGDVRSGSVKRVASAVGEGSVVVQAIHARLASLREAEAREPVTL